MTMELDWSRGELAEGLRCYCAEEFFLAHEHWELVWLRLPEPEKTFLQALIQVAAAFHHLQRGNRPGAESLLRHAQRRMEPLPDVFGGISVEPLRRQIEERLSALEARDTPLPHLASPQIQPVGTRSIDGGIPAKRA
jgi:predicted metal-dependent hydrolase